MIYDVRVRCFTIEVFTDFTFSIFGRTPANVFLRPRRNLSFKRYNTQFGAISHPVLFAVEIIIIPTSFASTNKLLLLYRKRAFSLFEQQSFYKKNNSDRQFIILKLSKLTACKFSNRIFQRKSTSSLYPPVFIIYLQA